MARYVQRYAERYIHTGSAAPVFHIALTIGCCSYLTECTRHWWSTLADRQASRAAERELHTALDRNAQAVTNSKNLVEEGEKLVASTRKAHQDAVEKLAVLEKELSEREAAYQEVKQKTEKKPQEDGQAKKT